MSSFFTDHGCYAAGPGLAYLIAKVPTPERRNHRRVLAIDRMHAG
jgi:hypothetical protein